MKGTKLGASATVAGREFQRRTVLLIIVIGSGKLSVFKRETRASPFRCGCPVLACWNVHKEMHNFEEHDQLIFGSSRLQGFPFQVVQHRGHTTCVMVSVGDIPGCSTIINLNFLDILLGIGGQRTFG